MSVSCQHRKCLDDLKVPDFDLDPVKAHCEKLALDILNAIIPAINKKFPDAYPGNIFKKSGPPIRIVGGDLIRRQSELLAAI